MFVGVCWFWRDASSRKLECPSSDRGGVSYLVVPFRAACWDDQEKLLRSQGFCFPVDPESQMAVSFADAERKDLLQMEEAAAISSHFLSSTGLTLHPTKNDT